MFQRLSVSARLSSLMALLFIGLFAVLGSVAWHDRGLLFEERRVQHKNLVDGAIGTLANFHQRQKDGQLSEDDAQKQALAALRGFRYEDGNYFWVNSSKPMILLHPAKPGLEGKDASDIKDPSGRAIFREFADLARKGGGVVDYEWPKPGSSIAVPKTSHVSYFAPWDMTVGTGSYVDDIEAAFMERLVSLMVIGVVFMLTTSLFAYFLIRSITGPLARTVEEAGELAAGNAGIKLTHAGQNDEIGAVAKAIALFRDRIVEQQNLSQQAHNTSIQQQSRQSEVDALISKFRCQVGAVLGDVSAEASQMHDAAEDLHQEAIHATERAKGALEASDRANENIETGAAAARELNSAIREIQSQVEKTTEGVVTASQAAEVSSQKVESLSSAAQKIGEVVTLIQAIAEQTNLLALNATIEAARAGEAGRGFAVVAAEVKELATQTSKATEEISAQIYGIQGSTREAVSAIEEITSRVDDVKQYTAMIATTVSQQADSVESIGRNVEEAVEGTKQSNSEMLGVVDAASRTDQRVDTVAKGAAGVSAHSEKLKGEVDAFLDAVAAA